MPTPMELAAQRAQQDGSVHGPHEGVSITPVRPGGLGPSKTDWGELRGPNNHYGDGGMSTISLPPLVRDQVDDGGLGSMPHPGTDPYKHLLLKPAGELTEEERQLLLSQLSDRERARQQDLDSLALENERFQLEKKRKSFTMMRAFAVGFAIFATVAFVLLIGMLLYISFKNQAFNDTSVITSILNTFATFFQILAGM